MTITAELPAFSTAQLGATSVCELPILKRSFHDLTLKVEGRVSNLASKPSTCNSLRRASLAVSASSTLLIYSLAKEAGEFWRTVSKRWASLASSEEMFFFAGILSASHFSAVVARLV